MDATKVCSKCKQEKRRNEFHTCKGAKDGLKSECKECRNRENKQYRVLHPFRCHTPITGTTKKCSICRLVKPAEDFGKNCCGKDGRDSRCRLCRNKYDKEINAMWSKIDLFPTKTHKICVGCNQEKPIEEFYSRKARRHGISKCKSCWAEIRKSQEYKRKFSERDKRNAKRYNQIHGAEKSEYNHQYNKENRSAITKRIMDRKRSDPEFKTLCTLKARVLGAVRQQCTKKAYHTAELIGCSVPDLMKHLESQFKEGMTWQNHSRFGWHIDHVIPCSAFDLSKPEEQKKCFHYTNLQPMWATPNLKKNSWHNGKLYRKK